VRATGFMTTDVLTLLPSASIKEAAAALAARAVASAPVVADDGTLVGIVSELDLLAHDVPPDPLAHLSTTRPEQAEPPRVVADVMTRQVVTLPPEADAAEFLRHMLADRILCIPVVDGERVVGVVSRRDLLRLLARPDGDIAADLEGALAAALPGEGWRADVADGIASLSCSGADPQPNVAIRVAQGVAGVVRVHLADQAPSV
jgi:CBS domain-containing protein